jgi:hypothetical protein
LQQEYVRAASRHGNAILAGDYRTANRSAKILAGLQKKLAQQRVTAELVLRELFSHSDPSVRTWAAADALELELAVEEALATLQKVSEDRELGAIRLEAEMLLRERRGAGW